MGTNNHGHTAEQVTGGIKAIVQLVNERQPQARVVVLVREWGGQWEEERQWSGTPSGVATAARFWAVQLRAVAFRQNLMLKLAVPIIRAVVKDIFGGK